MNILEHMGMKIDSVERCVFIYTVCFALLWYVGHVTGVGMCV
jgi:hypothetical protein